MTDNKIKILTLSDHPLSPSGVGTQTKYIIEGLLKTGRYQIISFGGAVKHEDYTGRLVIWPYAPPECRRTDEAKLGAWGQDIREGGT